MNRCLSFNNLTRLLCVNWFLVLFYHVDPLDNRPIITSVDFQNLTNPTLILAGDNFHLVIFSQTRFSLPHFLILVSR
jgi:hypothetical protein